MTPEQLPLGIALRDSATFANFYLPQAHPNRQAVSVLESFPAGDEPVIYLWGEAGSGVSHLLQAACQSAEAAGRSFQYLPLESLLAGDAQASLEGLEHLDLVCIDDLQLLAGQRSWQTALFHCYNRIKDHNGRLLLGARLSPNGLDLQLADLRSRLQWALVFHLQPLSDRDKLGALQSRSRLRGFELPEEVARYILHRAPRDTGALFAMLEQLDRASLMAQRKITIPFVKQVLGI